MNSYFPYSALVNSLYSSISKHVFVGDWYVNTAAPASKAAPSAAISELYY